jgi:PAS domain S-box-containing protein
MEIERSGQGDPRRSRVVEVEEIRKDGTTLWAEIRAGFLRDAKGEAIGIVGVTRDISERKRAEERLTVAHTRLDRMSSSNVIGVVVADAQGGILEANDYYLNLLGFTRQELETGQTRWDAQTPPEHLPADKRAIEELRARGVCTPYEKEYIRKDGSRVWVLIADVLLPGVKEQILALVLNITDRKRLEREVVTRERYLNSFFTGATAGLALLDKDLRYIQINDTLAEMNGAPAGDHLGRTVREVVPRLAPMVEPFFRKVLTTREPVLNIEVTGETPNQPGIQRYWMESFFPIAGADGTPEAVGAIVVEITDRKKVEQQLLDYQNRLRELAAELTLAEERQRRHIAVGVHDQIGQRLALAKLTLQSLQASTGEADTSRIVEGVCKDIDQVLEDAHSLTFELSNPILYEVGFEPAVESWLFQQVQDRHGIECTFEADGNPVALGKETRVVLFDIVRELLTNVVKHAKAKQVDVRIRRIDGAVQISIQDDGIGFQPPGSGTHVSESGGFGLFNIREKLDYLGGSITIESAPGEGTCVVVVVPLMYPRNSGK